MNADRSQFTRLLAESQAGDPRAAETLFPLVYAALRDLAQRQMNDERGGHTLQATALVHEAYLKLVGGAAVEFNGRAHFFRAAAEAMRRILIDHAKARGRAKRGGKIRIESLRDCDLALKTTGNEILSIDEAICRLEQRHPAAGEVVRLRFYAGLSIDQTAEALGLSASTVTREWAFARAVLFRELTEGES